LSLPRTLEIFVALPTPCILCHHSHPLHYLSILKPIAFFVTPHTYSMQVLVGSNPIHYLSLLTPIAVCVTPHNLCSLCHFSHPLHSLSPLIPLAVFVAPHTPCRLCRPSYPLQTLSSLIPLVDFVAPHTSHSLCRPSHPLLHSPLHTIPFKYLAYCTVLYTGDLHPAIHRHIRLTAPL
jgi:hypothetical protein